MADPVKGFLLSELRDYKGFFFNEGVKGFFGGFKGFSNVFNIWCFLSS